MTTTKLIYSTLIGSLFIFLFFTTSSCETKDEKKTEICDCFKIRLEIKKMIETADNAFGLIETEKYKSLSEKKEKCFNIIEPQYFEEREVYRNGRNEKEFLLDELGDCKAVRELLEVEK